MLTAYSSVAIKISMLSDKLIVHVLYTLYFNVISMETHAYHINFAMFNIFTLDITKC